MRHLQSFKYVQAIVRAGSIRGAAESLTISPSALNRHIQTLELDLGIQLFERLSRGVRLSAEGEVFYTFALRQLAGFDQVKAQLSNLKGQNHGELRIGVDPGIHLNFFHKLIADYQREFPNVHLTFQYLQQQELLGLLNERKIEMALALNPVMSKGLQLLQARDIEFTAFVPVGTGLAPSGGLNLYELDQLRVALPPISSDVSLRIISAFEKNKIDPIVTYQGPSLHSFLEHTYQPVVGIFAVLELNEDPLQIPGYKRTSLIATEVGTSMIGLVCSDQYVNTLAAHQFQATLSAYFQ